MKLSLPRTLGLSVLALAAAASLGLAQIERLDLAQMISKTDNAVVGQIIDREVFRVDDPVDGPELYFTTLTVQGKSLYDGRQLTVPVTFAGGFITPDEGVYNSEAPSADDVRIGNQVVVFYKWTDNMGGQVAANALYASHGGLYRVVPGTRDRIVLGRGDGYAISSNTSLTGLTTAVAKLR